MVLIVHYETLIDVFKDYVALAFIVEMDDLVGYVVSVEQTDWLSVIPREETRNIIHTMTRVSTLTLAMLLSWMVFFSFQCSSKMEFLALYERCTSLSKLSVFFLGA